MNPFSSFPQEDARVEKDDSSVLGPYKAIFAGATIVITDENADVEEGDVILRALPNGKDERSIVTEAKFFEKMQSIGAHYQIKYTKTGTSKMQKPSAQNITINNAQSVQVGDNNTQNIVNAFEALKEQIESSDSTPEQKEEAKLLLSKLASHPLVVSILGAATGGLVG